MEAKSTISKKRNRIIRNALLISGGAGLLLFGFYAYNTKTTAEKLKFDVKNLKINSANLSEINFSVILEITNPTNDSIKLTVPQITVETMDGNILVAEFPAIVNNQIKKIEIKKNSITTFPEMFFKVDVTKLGLFTFNQVNLINDGLSQNIKLKIVAKGMANIFPYTKEKIITI